MDCWGLVRAARVELFDKPLLPLFADIQPADKKGLTRACAETVNTHQLTEVKPQSGAIACAYQGSVCVHVGIVVGIDGMLFVLETDEGIGVTRTRLSVFESRYVRVIYYD